MKKFKHGMVLGKFYPPHNGHLFLIDSALEQCEKVTVFACSLPNETIDGELRYLWLWKIYNEDSRVNVIHINKVLPQTPEEHGDIDGFYKLYCDEVNPYFENGDVIFTSEKYGDEFASYLNVEHVLIDLPRLTHSVSGTSIRNNPIENWEHIPDVVKPHFKKKIVILGPESTGKSILTKRLSEHFKGDIIHEFGRTYTDVNPAKKMDVQDFENIAMWHDTVIKTTVSHGEKPLIFIDTEAITTYLFGGLYLGKGNFYSEKIMEIILNQKFDLVLLCDIDVPWVDDGTRDFPNKRAEHLNDLRNALIMFQFKFKMISGNYDERFELAKKYVKELT